VKVVTKEKKEKENVLIYLELVNLNNAFLLNSKELRRKIIKVEKEKLVEEKEYKNIYVTIASTIGGCTKVEEEFGLNWR
jgi:hypothetical protein